MAFTLREKRYKYECSIREEQKKIQGLRKDLDTHKNEQKLVEHTLKSYQEGLEAFEVIYVTSMCKKGKDNFRS